jgi:hypothetical protein
MRHLELRQQTTTMVGYFYKFSLYILDFSFGHATNVPNVFQFAAQLSNGLSGKYVRFAWGFVTNEH